MRRRSVLPAPLGLAVLVFLAGCKLVDQRTFDASVNHRPVAHAMPGPPGPPPIPPLAAVRFAEPPETWQPALTDIVRQALAAKPEALFQVQTLVPATGTPQAQAAALAEAGRGNGRLVAETIVAAGASSGQVEMTAMSDGSVTQPEVRVTVK